MIIFPDREKGAFFRLFLTFFRGQLLTALKIFIGEFLWLQKNLLQKSVDIYNYLKIKDKNKMV